MNIYTILPVLTLGLSGCVLSQQPALPEGATKPNHIITKIVAAPTIKPPINASFGYKEDPAIKAAYDELSKTGNMPNIKSDGFMTFAYEPHHHFKLVCEPLHLCVVQLEAGENINNIDLGDAANWLINTALVGATDTGAYQITIKPKHEDIVTDMVVTTSKRTYNFGLISKAGKGMHTVAFLKG